MSGFAASWLKRTFCPAFSPCNHGSLQRLFSAPGNHGHHGALDLPTDLHGVELIWQRLDLAGLYARLLAESCYEDRKNLSYIGGIRVGPGDVGWPSLYA